MKFCASHFVSLFAIAGILMLAGCVTDSTDRESNKSIALSTSLPISALNAMFGSREAMIGLATGETADAVQAYAQMQAAMEPLNAFGERMNALANSFNDADYLHFWNQLSTFGSLYQINAGTLSASRLRGLEQSLWSFKNDVHSLNRTYGDYQKKLKALMDLLDPADPVATARQNVPLVNSITERTVELDVLIKDFANNLFEISRLLSNAQMNP
ncbi:MAG TPA: hypothetical protein VK995_01755 [Oceanipulchritudo sp.]|nr:hypothetical protein [Oceanipulchritudo sp.]